MTCFHYCPNPPCLLSSIGTRVYLLATWPLQDIRLLRSCRALLNHPFIPPPTCIAHPGAILLHNYWTVCDFPSDHPLYGIHHTILVLTILCRGQLATPLAYLLLRTPPTARLPTNPPHRPPPLVYRILATPLSSSLTRNSLHRPPLVYRTILVERLRAAALLSTSHSPRLVSLLQTHPTAPLWSTLYLLATPLASSLTTNPPHRPPLVFTLSTSHSPRLVFNYEPTPPLGHYTILPFPLLYGVWHTKEG